MSLSTCNDKADHRIPRMTGDVSQLRMPLPYHPDIRGSTFAKIYAERGGENDEPEIPSRRAIIYNLPPDTTLTQVLRCITSGQVIAVDLIPPGLTIGTADTCNAIIEFICGSQIQTWMELFRIDPPVLRSASGLEYEAKVWLVPTPSFPVKSKTQSWASMSFTRTLNVGNVPVSAVWFLISALRAKAKLVDVSYNAETQSCTIEFAHIYSAMYFYSMIREGLINFLTENDKDCYCEPSQDASTVNPQYLVSTCDTIDHITTRSLDDSFNTLPFNEYWPTSYFYIMTLCGLQPRLEGATTSPSESSDDDQMSTAEDDSELGLGENVPTQYRIIGSSIMLTRHKHSWSISADDDRKLCMANTLHDPEWAKEWDAYFSSGRLVNIRTWELYGMIARHRREVARNMGLAEGLVPLCNAQCQEGCTSIQRAPLPELVAAYLKPPEPVAF